MKMKVVTIVGTRPELIKLSETIKLFDIFFDHVLVHTGQNYDANLKDVFFQEFELRDPDYYLGIDALVLGDSIGQIISNTYSLLMQLEPDAVLILGDTNSSLSAISAKRLKIPIFHLEAGNRCFDINLPEEINRKIVDHLADVNVCYSEQAKQNLLTEGLPAEVVFVSGSPMRELYEKYKKNIACSDILKRLNMREGGYFVVSAHREDTVDSKESIDRLCDVLNHIESVFKKSIIFSMHPRTANSIKKNDSYLSDSILQINPLSFFDYVKLQSNSFCVLSDSGTLAEEASYFNFPAVSLRTSSERPEAVEKGKMFISKIQKDPVVSTIDIVTSGYNSGSCSTVGCYEDVNFSWKVVGIVSGYKDIVNDRFWRKIKL